MAFHPIQAFQNPVTRPRAIIWAGTVIVFLVFFVTFMVGATTTYWFCSAICHNCQDDTITAYQASTHKNISCVSCHMPAGADPVSYLIHKVEALAEIPPTLMNTFEIPLNPESAAALHPAKFPDIQCTQCHTIENRKITPSAGIIINHEVHTEAGVRCTFCHNRIAHYEKGMTFANPTKRDGKPNTGHFDFMEMTACYRCHGLEEGSPAPGECKFCHTKDFDLKPETHDDKEFLHGGHGKAFDHANEIVAEAVKEFHLEAEPTPESKTEQVQALAESGDSHGGGHGHFELPVAPPSAINECYTCHKQSFCSDCHGMDVPHTKEFIEPKGAKDPTGHPALAKNPKLTEKCVMCHGGSSEAFCDNCHHGTKPGWEYDKDSDWTAKQHAKAVAKTGIAACTTQCHTAQFCSDCHNSKRIIPASHKKSGFTYSKTPAMTKYGSAPAEVSAGHAVAAVESTESCAVCHGGGGVNGKFCKSCHGMKMPHDDNFKKFHSKSKPAKCQKCHNFREVCSSCHHAGAKATTRWTPAHGPAVNKKGSETCAEKCHTQKECVKCHQRIKVEPASHKSSKFVKGGVHAKQFNKDASNCLYCHSGNADTLANSKFCKKCHKLEMPHTQDGGKEKFAHKDKLKKGSYKRSTCLYCHSQRFCDNCHHPESSKSERWYTYHAKAVKKSDNPQACYDCHKETYCAYCHVRLSRKR